MSRGIEGIMERGRGICVKLKVMWVTLRLEHRVF